MKKPIILLLAAVMLFSFAACGPKTGESAQPTAAPTQAPTQATTQAPAETPAPADEPEEWTRSGYFRDEAGNMMSVTWMDVDTEAGWYVALMLGTESWGNFLPQLGRNLRGDLIPEDDGEMIVTVSPEGTDGLVLEVEGGDTYRFAPMEIQEATINVSVDTQGMGIVDYAPGDVPPEYDPENLIRHAWINLSEPAVYAFNAWPDEGYVFVEWQKNGETFSESPELVTELAESADYVAVFAELGDGQNPVMNWVGEYAAGRAHALVECQGSDEARITIEWGDSAWSLGRWIMSGRLDEDTQTVEYSDCVYSYVVYTDEGELESETV